MPRAKKKLTLRLPERKPMARAERIPLYMRPVDEQLSEAAIALLLDSADTLSEGRQDGAGRFFGSTMLTLDVATLSARLRHALDVDEIARLMQSDRRVQKRMRALAESDATLRAGFSVRMGVGDLQLRVDGTKILVDIDVEGAQKARRA